MSLAEKQLGAGFNWFQHRTGGFGCQTFDASVPESAIACGNK
jgi:hypothetical protein